jgi:Predicted membrane protein (DUF2306)
MIRKALILVGWGIVLVFTYYFIYNNAFRYFNYSSPLYDELLKPFAPLLITHISGGIIAIVLGPLQFIPIIRKRYKKWHRLIGKIYLIAVLIGGLAAITLATAKVIMLEHAIAFGTGLLGLGIAWLFTSGMAFWAVRKRNFVQHREWMIRSYVVTCGFTSFRIFTDILNNYMHADGNQIGITMAWACWAIPLLITEMILQSRKISPPIIKKKSADEAISTTVALH